MKGIKAVTAIPLLLAALLTGCTGSNQADIQEKQERVTIKVMYPAANNFLYDYSIRNEIPGLSVEVADMQKMYDNPADTASSAYEKFIEASRPDVLWMTLDQYEKMAASGKLLALDPLIAKSGFDLQGIHPDILAALKNKGQGQYYGMSPMLSSMAVIYNADLFKKYNIEPPEDSMSWQELLSLASRFPSEGPEDSRVYGFAFNVNFFPKEIASTIAALSSEPGYVTEDGQLVINTEGWRSAFHTVKSAVDSKALWVFDDKQIPNGFDTTEKMLARDVFLSGRAAMKLIDPFYFSSLELSRTHLQNVTPFEWRLVTAPVAPERRDQSMYLGFDVFGISASSDNPEAAWEFIRHVSDKPFAEKKGSLIVTEKLPTRTGLIRDIEGHSLDAFYKLGPMIGPATADSSAVTIPASFASTYSSLYAREFEAFIQGKKTADRALTDLEKSARSYLKDAIERKERAEAREKARQ